MAQELGEKILQHLSECDKVDTLDLAKIFNEDHQKIVGALKSIQANGDLIDAENKSEKYWELTEEGQSVVQHGILVNYLIIIFQIFCVNLKIIKK